MRSILSLAKRAFSGLRLRLLLMVLLACAPLVALVLHAAWEDRRRARAAWQSQLGNILQIARNEEKKIVDSTRQLLLAVSEVSGVPTFDPEAANISLLGIHKSYSRYANLGLLATNGDVVASAAPAREANLRGHLFFKRVMERHTFAVGGVSFPASSGGSPHVFFGYPVRNAAGNLTGVVYADLDLNARAQDSDIRRNLPASTTWMAVDWRGRILASFGPAGGTREDNRNRPRLPQTERPGRKLTDGWLLTNAFTQFSGTLEARDRDGTWNVYAFAPLRSRFVSGDAAGILATPREALFAAADRALRTNLVALAIAAVIALALVWI